MSTILDGLPGVICLVDDILVFGACQEEHDQRLQAVLQRLASAGLTLNGEKGLFSVSQLCFCGYLIGKDGIRPDPANVTALTEMPSLQGCARRTAFPGIGEPAWQILTKSGLPFTTSL